jgi:sugar diacid utilization regulator
MWQCLLEVAPQQDHGHLAVLALDYADHVSRAAAQAYVEERQRVVQSRQDAARVLLTRIINQEATDDPEVALEAAELGLDFNGPHVALIVSGARDHLRPSTQTDLVLARLQPLLAEAVPDALVVLLSVGVVAVIPGQASEAAEAVIRAALTAAAQDPAHPFAVGWGTPVSGASRLASSYRAAARAHALGAILQPRQLVHRYSELSLFDLFKEGQTTDAFVIEVLRPMLELNSQRRQRMADSLDALFSAALNRKLASRRLGIHHNTLAHRIRRIEELLGGSLLSGEFCFRVQLALRLLPLTQAARN